MCRIMTGILSSSLVTGWTKWEKNRNDNVKIRGQWEHVEDVKLITQVFTEYLLYVGNLGPFKEDHECGGFRLKFIS